MRATSKRGRARTGATRDPSSRRLLARGAGVVRSWWSVGWGSGVLRSSVRCRGQMSWGPLLGPRGCGGRIRDGRAPCAEPVVGNQRIDPRDPAFFADPTFTRCWRACEWGSRPPLRRRVLGAESLRGHSGRESRSGPLLLVPGALGKDPIRDLAPAVLVSLDPAHGPAGARFVPESRQPQVHATCLACWPSSYARAPCHCSTTFAATEEIDFVSSLSAPFPLNVIAELLGTRSHRSRRLPALVPMPPSSRPTCLPTRRQRRWASSARSWWAILRSGSGAVTTWCRCSPGARSGASAHPGGTVHVPLDPVRRRQRDRPAVCCPVRWSPSTTIPIAAPRWHRTRRSRANAIEECFAGSPRCRRSAGRLPRCGGERHVGGQGDYVCMVYASGQS